MRILLDECVPVTLARELAPHEAASARRLGWTSLNDGEILLRAAGQFDALLTVDQSLEYQQVVPRSLILVTIVSRSIQHSVLREFVGAVLKELEVSEPGTAVRITAPR